MQKQLFRQKTLDRVSSPEQLHDYMRVTNPAIWMLLGAVVALLAGLLVLSSVRTLETTLDVRARIGGGTAYVTLPAAQAKSVKAGMPMRIAGEEVAIETVYLNDDGETVCTADIAAQDGTYDAVIVTDAVTPIRFLLN